MKSAKRVCMVKCRDICISDSCMASCFEPVAITSTNPFFETKMFQMLRLAAVLLVRLFFPIALR